MIPEQNLLYSRSMILALNPGSSSLKWMSAHPSGERIHHANMPVTSVEALTDALGTFPWPQVTAVGLRVVHGGTKFYQPTLVTPSVITELEQLIPLAPLHLPYSLAVTAYLQKYHADIPVVAVFDTSFHSKKREVAAVVPVPAAWRQPDIQRYGFHGLAHQAMLESYAQARGKPADECTILTVQLGSGSSIAAIDHGIAVDTTMGVSPLEGLPSRTRSGSIDPTLVALLSARHHKTASEVVQVLNEQSGLQAIGGHDGDMKRLKNAALQGDDAALLAISYFVYQIQKYLGAMTATLTVLPEAYLFGGGISEHVEDIVVSVLSRPIFGVTFLEQSFEPLNEGQQSAVRFLPTSVTPRVGICQIDEELLLIRQVVDHLAQQ